MRSWVLNDSKALVVSISLRAPRLPRSRPLGPAAAPVPLGTRQRLAGGSVRASLRVMARLNLTLDVETAGLIERHARRHGLQRAALARELIREALAKREADERQRQLARDYAAGSRRCGHLVGGSRGPAVRALGRRMTAGPKKSGRAGRVTPDTLKQLERALALHLGLLPA